MNIQFRGKLIFKFQIFRLLIQFNMDFPANKGHCYEIWASPPIYADGVGPFISMVIANARHRFFQLCSASDSEGPLYSMVLANAKHRFLRLWRLSAWLSNVPEGMNLDKLHRWSILLAGVGHHHRYKRPTTSVAKGTLLLLSHITYKSFLYYIWISVVVRDTASGATCPGSILTQDKMDVYR